MGKGLRDRFRVVQSFKVSNTLGKSAIEMLLGLIFRYLYGMKKPNTGKTLSYSEKSMSNHSGTIKRASLIAGWRVHLHAGPSLPSLVYVLAFTKQ